MNSHASRYCIASLASESASLDVAVFVTCCSVSEMQQRRHGGQLLWCLVLLQRNVVSGALQTVLVDVLCPERFLTLPER